MAEFKNETYEDIIRTTNVEIHGLIVNNIDLIPLFDAPKEWRQSTDAIWHAVYRELEGSNQFDDVLSVLNIVAGKFNTLQESRLREFIGAFPTLTWIMLLESRHGDSSAFRMLLAADRLDFIKEGLELIGPLKNRESYLKALSFVYRRVLTDPIIMTIRTLDQAISLRPYFSNSKWTIRTVSSKGYKLKLNTPGLYYYAVVFAPNVDFFDWSNKNVPDDALVYYINANRTTILNKSYGYLVIKSEEYAADDKPLALRTLTTIAQIGMLSNTTMISSAAVLDVLYQDKLIRFDNVWAANLSWISQDALARLIDLNVFDINMVVAILSPLLASDNIFEWFITQPRIKPHIVALDIQEHLLEWFTKSMTVTKIYTIQSTFTSLKEAGIRLHSFTPVTILLNDFVFIQSADLLLDFDLAFNPTNDDWTQLLIEVLKRLDFRTHTLVTKILEKGGVYDNRLNSLILSFNHNIKALKNARRKKVVMTTPGI